MNIMKKKFLAIFLASVLVVSGNISAYASELLFGQIFTFGSMSNSYKLEDRLEFDIDVKGGDCPFQNFMIVFSNMNLSAYDERQINVNGYKEYAVIRCDSWGWGAGDNKSIDGYDIIYDINLEDYNGNENIWDDLVEIMADAHVDAVITKTSTGIMLEYAVTGANGRSYTYRATTNFDSSEGLYVYFVCDQSMVSLELVENTENKNPDSNNTNTDTGNVGDNNNTGNNGDDNNDDYDDDEDDDYDDDEDYDDDDEEDDDEYEPLDIEDCTIKGIKASYAYTGKAIKPVVRIKDDDGYILEKNIDYTITYKNNKKIGNATIIIKGKGDYEGKYTQSFKIVPKKQSIKFLKASPKGFKLKLKKDNKATGYQVQYSLKSSMKGAVTKTIKDTGITQKKLKAKKKYYVRVRTYVKKGKSMYYGQWSKKLTVKTK